MCRRASETDAGHRSFGSTAQLLGEILLHRANVKAMMRYVSEVDNLKLMMVLLKDQSRSIQFEAFHVFKACPVSSHMQQDWRTTLVNPSRLLVACMNAAGEPQRRDPTSASGEAGAESPLLSVCSRGCDVLAHTPASTALRGGLVTRLQVFVANPNKTQPIIDILAGNKDKLLRYLADFHSDKSARILALQPPN